MKLGLTIRSGNMTLMTVFMTAMIAFLLLLSDNVRAVNDKSAAQADVAAEQAFYASQSCLEEAYLQLREVAPTERTTIVDVTVGTANCQVEMVPNLDTTQAGDGSIQSTGSAQASIRTVTSAYTGAGPTPTRQNAAIFHILDRSGSMGLDKLDSNGQPTKGCSDPAPGLDNRLACLNAGKLWDWHPSVFVKVAAIDFLKFLDSRHDKIGLVTFSGSVSLDQELTDNYSQVEDKIKAYELYDNTNIGGALRMATENLPPVSSGQTRVSILLTDGAPTVSHGPFNPREYALAEANFAKSDEHKIIVITIGLGAAALLPDNDNLLEDMASEVDGKKLHFRAARTQDLKDIYKEIDRFLKEYNIDQGSWNEL